MVYSSPMDSKPLIIGQDISPKLAATHLLRRNGFSLNDTAQAFDISKTQVLNRQRQLPPSLKIDSRKRVKLAAKAATLVLQGLSVGEAQVKGSDVVKMISEVYDRAQPVKSGAPDVGQINYTQVNLAISNGSLDFGGTFGGINDKEKMLSVSNNNTNQSSLMDHTSIENPDPYGWIDRDPQSQAPAPPPPPDPRAPRPRRGARPISNGRVTVTRTPLEPREKISDLVIR